MSVSFEKTPLFLGLSGGVAISSAIVAMNTLPAKNMQMAAGMPLFTLGWVLVIIGFLKNTTRAAKYKNVLAVSSVVVYTAAMVARMMMDNNIQGAPMTAAKLVFLAAWVSLAVFMGMKKKPGDAEVHDGRVHALALVPPALVVVSMMSVNTLERPGNVPSGPGMPLFLLAWVVLSMVNSYVV